jgi:segregation and condensation protein B
MSLKAKMEAVIYASEEPVTLAQLAGLLGHEAQFELDRMTARQRSLALAGEAESPDIEPSDGLEPEPEAVAEAPPQVEAIDTAAEKRVAKEAKEKERRLREYFREILDRLIADYATESNERGLEIREVAGGFRMATKPEYHDAVRGFIRGLKPPLKLSLQALETLAVVAYKQPVTAPEITEIRGVDSGGVLGSLMGRKLITTAGRKPVIGRPILYKTTKDFLIRFGLKDLNELPSIEEFEKMAGDLADIEPVQEEIPIPMNPEDDVPDTVATPEGDNEFAPDEPLKPIQEGFETPPGSEPDVYRQPEDTV